MSLVIVGYCKVEFYASARSLVQRSLTGWCVVVCDLETSEMRRSWPTGGGGLSHQKQTNKHGSDNIYIWQIFRHPEGIIKEA